MICILQAAATGLFLTIGFYIFYSDRFTLLECCIIGSIGIATAPALTFILMNRLKIEGRLKSVLGNIVVVDDVICVIAFSLTLGAAVMLQKSGQVY